MKWGGLKNWLKKRKTIKKLSILHKESIKLEIEIEDLEHKSRIDFFPSFEIKSILKKKKEKEYELKIIKETIKNYPDHKINFIVFNRGRRRAVDKIEIILEE